jgi:murein DD-endopeptidase MepM/ murein hydrolase activator NlpD
LGIASICSMKAYLSNNAVPLLVWVLYLFLLTGCSSQGMLSPASGADDSIRLQEPVRLETLQAPEPDNSVEPNTLIVPSSAPTNEPAKTVPVYFTPTPETANIPDLVAHFSFCSPLEDHSLADLQEIISFPYDPPPPGKDTGHHGVDFAYYRRGERISILGVSIQSFLPGRVVAANENLVPYGYMVIIETRYDQMPEQLVEFFDIPFTDSLYHLYAHMDEHPLVEVGQEVECGQTLGYVGNTPENWSSAPHLHFEARFGPPEGQFSGMQFYDKYSTVDQMEKYILWRMSGEYILLDPLALLVFGLEQDVSPGD